MIATPAIRTALPRPADRLALGGSGLQVSPVCIGITDSPDTVIAAYEAGVNFFFITADLHWPLYDGVRKGVAKLLQGNKARRDEIVVGVVSYLDEPLFGALQFHEVIAEVPGLERVDLLIAGAISSEQSFYQRLGALLRARGHLGSRAVGATFHHRPLAAVASHSGALDIEFVRYNSAHPGATRDLFPYLPPVRSAPMFNFKSTMSLVTREAFDRLPVNNNGRTDAWLPDVTDYYRFVLTRPQMDGILCSAQNPTQIRQLVEALERGPLAPEQESYMLWLSSQVHSGNWMS